MKITIEKITPDTAKEWLEHNLPTNRNMRQRHIERLADDMRNNRWNDDGAPYRFDKDGNLLDGQHRLMAIIRSGKTVSGVVVRGLERDAFTTMDIGSKRTTADALHISGEGNSPVLAGALLIVAEYLRDGHMYTTSGKGQPTTQELVDTLDTVPKVRESVRLVMASGQQAKTRSGTKALLLSPSLTAGLHALFDDKDGAMADEFVQGLATGFDPAKRPVFALLRERLLGNRMSRAKLPRHAIAALAIKAWNGERSSTKPRVLKLLDGESFPEIK